MQLHALPRRHEHRITRQPDQPSFCRGATHWLARVARHLTYGYASCTSYRRGISPPLSQIARQCAAIGDDTLFTGHTEQLAALALRHGIPAIFQFRESLLLVQRQLPSLLDVHRLVGVYAGCILEAEPRTITEVELAINLRPWARHHHSTAAHCKLRADEVDVCVGSSGLTACRAGMALSVVMLLRMMGPTRITFGLAGGGGDGCGVMNEGGVGGGAAM